MRLSRIVDAYCSDRRVSVGTHRRIGYELAIWFRLGGAGECTRIDRCQIDSWRDAAVASGLRPRTIESVIATVRNLASHAGCLVPVGRRLRHVPQVRAVPAFHEFSQLVESSPDWWRWWLMVAYVTGLRLGDLERVSPQRETVLVATKTGKRQRFPLPECVLRLDRGPLRKPRKSLRLKLRAACMAFGIAPVTPQTIRTLSAMEWERARPGCGPIILGHALPGWSGATPYYMDGYDQLAQGLPNLRIPPCVLTPEERAAIESGESRLVSAFRRLTPERRESLVSVASAMG